MPLGEVVLVLVFVFAGVTLKLADFFGEGGRRWGFVFAAASAVCLGVLMADNSVASSVVLGVVVGVLVAGKVDRLSLVFGLCLALVVGFVLGFKVPLVSVLGVVGVAAVLDEVCHDRFAGRGGLGVFFRFRGVLKVAVLFLVAVMWVDLVDAVGFFGFDLSYDAVDVALVRMGKEGR